MKAIYAGKTFAPQSIIDTPDEPLRAAGLSANKLLALRDLAKKRLDGTVPPLSKLAKMSDDEIVERLTEVRGIGRWTVEMLLIFRLGRPDVLPVGRLRRPQRLCAHARPRRDAEAEGARGVRREEVGAVPIDGELVHVARACELKEKE